MYAYNPRLIAARKISVAIIAGIVLAFSFAASSFAVDVPWVKGDRVHAVVVYGNSTSIESGFITGIDGNVCRVKWDKCNCETLVPVETLYKSLSQAHKAELILSTDDVSFQEAAQSAGKIGLIYMLLSQRNGK